MVSAADPTASTEYSGLLPRGKEPYRIISIEPEHAKIDQGGVRNTVSLNWSTRGSEAKKNWNVAHVWCKCRQKHESHDRESNGDEYKRSYTVEKIYGQENWPIRAQYIVCSYVYGPRNHTIETAAHFTEYFPDGYCQKVRKRQQGCKRIKNKWKLSVEQDESERTIREMNNPRILTLLRRSLRLHHQTKSFP